jgi:5-methylcytosine-specific restriction endonuclease McrA
MCGIENWLGKDITLELHHVDGNRFNNELSNLQILCPNCHSLTPNHGKKKPS